MKRWKTHTSPMPRGPKMTQEQVNRALMWLCAQPEVAKQIRKIWKNLPEAIANNETAVIPKESA